MTEETRRIILEEAARQDAEYNKYHNWEQGTKILINSFYGGLGNQYMYFFNVDLAECITKQGKDAILYAERNINKYFLEHWHRDKRTHKKMGITVSRQVKNEVTVYIDTDSCDKDTVIRCGDGKSRTISELYDECQVYGDAGSTMKGHESVNCPICVLNYNEYNEHDVYYAPVKRVIRHKVKKEKWKLVSDSGKYVIVTGDHSLIVFRGDKKIKCKPNEIESTDYVLIMNDTRYKLECVKSIECIGEFDDEYVYDIEMDDETHTFIGNDILVHNSVYSQLDEVISTSDWGIGPDHPNWKITAYKIGEKEPTIRYFGGNNERDYVVEFLGLDDKDAYDSYELEKVEGTAKDFALLLDEVFLADYFKYIFEKYAEKINADNYLNFELESYADAGIWLAKKKYMQNIRWLDKIPRHEIYDNLSKIKSKGVELIQASAPNFARKSLKHLVKWIFSKNDFEMKEIIAEVKEIKRAFDIAEVDDICWNKKSNNYYNFVLDDQKELVLKEGTPIYVKGVALYNHLLNEHPQYKSKYARLKDGMTCKFYYCKGEELDFFAYEPGMRPVEYAPEPDRAKMFEKTILEPLNRILSVIPGKSVIGKDLMYVGKLF